MTIGRDDPVTRERVRRRMLISEAQGYMDLGMPRQTLRSLDELDQSGGFSDVDDFHGLVMLLRGEALRDLKEYEQAIGPLESAATAMPGEIHPWVALGWCQKRTGRLEQAIRSLESALDRKPNEPLLHFNLACYWSLARDKPRALQYLVQALSLDSEYRRLIDDEPDFDPLREDPDFQAIREE